MTRERLLVNRAEVPARSAESRAPHRSEKLGHENDTLRWSDTLLACTLPRSFEDMLDSPLNRKYLSDYVASERSGAACLSIKLCMGACLQAWPLQPAARASAGMRPISSSLQNTTWERGAARAALEEASPAWVTRAV